MVSDWRFFDDPHNPWFQVVEGDPDDFDNGYREVGNFDRREDAEEVIRMRDALAADQAEIAALKAALGGLVGFIDEKEMWFDAPTSVDALEARMATARAILAGDRGAASAGEE